MMLIFTLFVIQPSPVDQNCPVDGIEEREKGGKGEQKTSVDVACLEILPRGLDRFLCICCQRHVRVHRCHCLINGLTFLQFFVL